MRTKRFTVVEYHDGEFYGVVAGLGRNAGTWDADHSRSAAYRHCKALNAAKRSPTLLYVVEEV